MTEKESNGPRKGFDFRLKELASLPSVRHVEVSKQDGIWNVTAVEDKRRIQHYHHQLGTALNSLLADYGIIYKEPRK